ncbi:TPA: efflux RND transporter periplasmic adaptor subunit [Serratia marcescens]|nr:efflux RND transporter periplasmic adaptor subunit [Serratia marcescens]
MYILSKHLPPPEGFIHTKSIRPFVIAMAVIACAALTGCGDVPSATPKAVPVHVVTVELSQAHFAIALSGTIVPRIESQLAFRVPGRVVERQADTGMLVPKGAVLARLDDTPFKLAVQEASAELAQAQATQARAKRDVERNRALAQSGAIAGADFDVLETLYTNAQSQVRAAQSRLERARNDLAYTSLTASAEGTVALVQAEVGQVVAAGTPVLRLARVGENEIQVDVPESRIGGIAKGDSVKAHLISLPGSELSGTVREVATVADPATRTYRVRITLPELPADARLGMTASVRFDAARDNSQVQLPITALYQQGEQPAVWVLPDGAQQLVLRPVSLAAMGTDTVTVIQGIEPGERVVIAGVHRLDANMTVQAWDGRLP